MLHVAATRKPCTFFILFSRRPQPNESFHEQVHVRLWRKWLAGQRYLNQRRELYPRRTLIFQEFKLTSLT